MKYVGIFVVAALSFGMFYAGAVIALIRAPIPAEYWLVEMIAVKQEILRQYAGQRKIILAGGSASLFGIDAKRATELLGVPVINFGLHGGMEMRRLIKDPLAMAERGDTLILGLEPPFYECNDALTKWRVSNIIAWDHEEWDKMSFPRRLEFISMVSPDTLYEMVVATFQKAFKPKAVEARTAVFDEARVLAKFKVRTPPRKFAYSAYHLSDYGDMLRIEGSDYKGDGWDHAKPSRVCPARAGYLKRLVRELNDRAVAVYFINSPYVDLGKGLENLREGERTFREDMRSIAPVIDRREDLVFERNNFFDTDLHLNATGRARRTEIFVNAVSARRTGLHPAFAPIYLQSSLTPTRVATSAQR